ncbi:MAG TPA: glycine--tRNA ligase subunit beta, partial [Candidatus Obscuribacter sp.]|nr:glycine--tRNA ligase subunit beta [Candidatus Obscuribacter sp.]
MSDYLLEVGVEELPAGFVPEALDRLCQLLKAELEANSIEFSEIASYATPRRLAALVKNISKMQKTTEKTVKGP